MEQIISTKFKEEKTIMKTKMTLSEKLFSIINVGRTAHAEEQPIEGTAPTGQPEGAQADPTVATPTQGTINFEALIVKARQEEKDKLYPEITRLKGELEDKVKRVNELLLSLGEKDESIKQLNLKISELEKGSKQSESDTVKGLNIKIEELSTTISLKDSEIANLKIESYKKEKINEAQGLIIPELVRGTTEEEINSSIELAKQRYTEILGQVKASVQPVAPQPTPVIPLANPTTQQFTTPEISTNSLSGMNMFDKNSRAEFEKMRAQLGLK